ncbi:hypothetical protein AKJ16_DCAP01770 [Drosera capensis]
MQRMTEIVALFMLYVTLLVLFLL